MTDKRRLAIEIERLLKQKHHKDVFVPQCKDGPTTSGTAIMDAWVMAKSWAHPLVTVYEIKVDRNDFLRDNKWHSYLAYCNCFYFVCPWKLIDPSEVSDDIGLMYASKNASRLYTKKKAPYRDVPIPESLYRYILMARTKIHKNEWGPTKDADYWRQWLEDRRENKKLGYEVGQQLRRMVGERVTRAEQNVRDMREQLSQYKHMEEILRDMGFNPHQFVFSTEFRKKLGVDHNPHLLSDLRRLHGSLGRIIGSLEDAR